ncbi:MAG: fused MFS/spermidine synthase [Pseudomonadales bacterium]|nr:fused MFS/spermidine synthase [Pseudomonadales bacterium]
MKTERVLHRTRRLWRQCALFSLSMMASLFCGVVSAEVLHEEKSVYRNIFVTEVDGRRCLMFNAIRGERNQTCMDMRNPKEFVFHYARMTMAGLLVNPNPQHILIAGLGGGTLPTALHEMYPDATIDILEIDQAVVNVAKNFFNFQESEQVQTHVVDARVFIKRAGLEGKKYDFIVLDAFTGEYIPEHLMTQEFLEEVKQVLTPDGVVVANTFSSSRLYSYESETYRAVFGDFFNLKMSGSGNRVIIAQQKPLPSMGELKANAQPLFEPLKPYGVDILEFPARMGTRPDWDQTRRVLTDQFSPANLLGR